MDIFRFMNPNHPTLFDQGILINGIRSKLWIERYRDAGEFQLIAPTSERLQTLLPIGSLISHTNTEEIMIVENHEINEENDKETEIKVTGRSFEAYLENRIVGSNKAWPTVASANEDYILSSDNTWNQAVKLIKDHIDAAFTIDDDDALLHVVTMTNVEGAGELFERSIKRGSVYERLLELLSVESLGIKTVRPSVRSPLGLGNDNAALMVYAGQDLTQEVAFSYSTGEIESADYLWSNKRVKNAALVTSKWFEIVIKNGSVGYDRRWMFVDASDLDNGLQEAPTGGDRDLILLYMYIRGQVALISQREIALVKTEPSKTSPLYKYREHYDVGDIITVNGQYSQTASMRISEYVEIEDEYGQSGYPTLSFV